MPQSFGNLIAAVAALLVVVVGKFSVGQMRINEIPNFPFGVSITAYIKSFAFQGLVILFSLLHLREQVSWYLQTRVFVKQLLKICGKFMQFYRTFALCFCLFIAFLAVFSIIFSKCSFASVYHAYARYACDW